MREILDEHPHLFYIRVPPRDLIGHTLEVKAYNSYNV